MAARKTREDWVGHFERLGWRTALHYDKLPGDISIYDMKIELIVLFIPDLGLPTSGEMYRQYGDVGGIILDKLRTLALRQWWEQEYAAIYNEVTDRYVDRIEYSMKGWVLQTGVRPDASWQTMIDMARTHKPHPCPF